MRGARRSWSSCIDERLTLSVEAGPVDTGYRVNEEECAAQVIDGEAVIINLLNGTYYSLDKVGGAIWELAAAGSAVPTIVQRVVARYDVNPDRARRDVERLVQELVTERLLVPATARAGEPDATSVQASDARLAYDEPVLTTYRDMAELLALDPPMPRLETLVWSEPADQNATKRAV